MPNWLQYVREHLDLPTLPRERAEKRIEDVACQLEDCYREACARGLPDEEAVRYAKNQIPDWDCFASDILCAEAANQQPIFTGGHSQPVPAQGGIGAMLADLKQDIAYGLRLLRKNPGFTTVAVLTLALGIGANAAIFSAVHAVLLRPFPYPEPDRLAVVSIFWPTGRFWLSEREVLLLREQSTLFEGFAVLDEGGAILLGEDRPQWLDVALVSANAFELVGVQPALGRAFASEEELPGGPAVVILSHELWQGRFGGDPNILGRVLEFEGSRPARVVGVMPRDFKMLVPRHVNFHHKVDVWYPHQVDYRTIDRGRNLVVLARRKSGVTWSQAQEELDRIAKGFFPSDSSNTYRAFPLQADTVQEIRPALLTLFVATGILLLIACVNVANLLLARGAARQKELAIRAALGATRSRIIRQSLTESCLLAVAGGTAGILLAWTGSGVLSSYLPSQLPRLEKIELDATVLGVSLGLSLLAGLLFGLAPALRSTRVEFNATLKEGGRGDGTGGNLAKMLRHTLIVGQIALSLMLLAGGGLIVRSFLNLRRADLGYDPANILTFTIPLPSSRYETGAERAAFARALQDRLTNSPGVESVGGNSVLPFGTSLWQAGFTFYESTVAPAAQPQGRQVLLRPVLPGYLETLQSRIVMGRSFTRHDTEDTQRVVIIDETLARSVWPGENPVGKRVALGMNPEEPLYRTVVGVVENLRITQLTGERRHQLYVPYMQWPVGRMSFFVRARTDPAPLLESIRGIVGEMDPNLPLHSIAQFEDTISEVMAPQRMTSLLMSLFAIIGLTLAVIGVYGVISYAVNQRTHEIGVRFALGAQRGHIYRIVLGQGLRLAVAGVALGLGGALALARTLESLLFRVSSSDPWSYAVASLALVAAAMLACWMPARKAARVDPMVALRYE